MADPIRIENFRYAVNMGCGSDAWMPFGRVYGHPVYGDGQEIFISTPRELDDVKQTIKTASGRTYQIVSFDCDDRDKWLAEVKKDIKQGGTEIL